MTSTTETAVAPNLRADIQGLRGLAILLVILLHAGVTLFQGGYVGVEVFFVISGFVVTGSLMRKPGGQLLKNLRNFYVKRILRLLPSSTAVIIVTLIAAFFLLGKAFNADLIEDAKWAAIFGTNFHLIDTGANYFIAGLDKSLLTHYWYLAIEQQFYLLYPLIIFLIVRLVPEALKTRVVAVLLALIVLASGWFSVYLTQADSVSAYYSPFTRAWEIALGGLVALIPLSWAKRSAILNSAVSLAALLALLASSIILGSQNSYPGFLAWWPSLCAAALIWANSNTTKISATGLLAFRPMKYLGDISYSLYLWHFIWLVLPGQMVNPPTAPWFVLVQLAGAFGCAAVSHHFIEDPIRKSKTLNKDALAALLFLLICLALIWDTTLLVENLWLVASGS